MLQCIHIHHSICSTAGLSGNVVQKVYSYNTYVMEHRALALKPIKKITHLKLCLATATHNFMWVKFAHICLI